MTAPERAPLGAALALLLSVVSLTGSISPVLMAAAIAAMGVLIGIAWPDLLELPSALGTRIVVAGSGIAGAATVLWAGTATVPTARIVMVCAVGVFASFVHQMLRRGRAGLTASLTGTVAGVFVTGVAACWVLAQSQAVSVGSAGLVTAISAGLATALLLNTVPLPRLLRFALAVAGGTAVAAALAATLVGLDALLGAVVGLVTTVGGACAHLLLGSSLVSRDPAPSIAVAAAPVATVGIVAHVAVLLLA